MKSLIKSKVSGKRRRFKDKEFDLDLSYITDSVIAMSFPASSAMERVYRNNINDVARFLDQRHGREHYYLYNMSNRDDLDVSKFHNQVVSYPWEDHHSPSLTVLFQSCEHMLKFLTKNSSNIVVINCNAGKGRTGTSISCLLIFTGLVENFV